MYTKSATILAQEGLIFCIGEGKVECGRPNIYEKRMYCRLMIFTEGGFDPFHVMPNCYRTTIPKFHYEMFAFWLGAGPKMGEKKLYFNIFKGCT